LPVPLAPAPESRPLHGRELLLEAVDDAAERFFGLPKRLPKRLLGLAPPLDLLAKRLLSPALSDLFIARQQVGVEVLGRLSQALIPPQANLELGLERVNVAFTACELDAELLELTLLCGERLAEIIHLHGRRPL
jgi:hypothetical protein